MTVILSADIWSCLCLVGVLFLGFCCPLWLLGECGGCVLPGRKFFWDPDRCGHWRFQVKYVSGYWELISRNGDGLGWGWGSKEGGRGQIFAQELEE